MVSREGVKGSGKGGGRLGVVSWEGGKGGRVVCWKGG